MNEAFYDKLREENQWDRYKAYLNSKEWDYLRNQRLMFDNFECQICGNRNQIQVHHLVYPHLYGQEHLSDLITVCQNCHSLLEELKRGQTVISKRAFIVGLEIDFCVDKLSDYYQLGKELSKKWEAYDWEHKTNSGIWLYFHVQEESTPQCYFELKNVIDVRYIQDTYGTTNEIKIKRGSIWQRT